ncbi:thiol-disulfide oxidoreductase DCC family protein [Geobacter argillaceus]|uniref:Putative DCC family thiol-disulfide oxidoreductase YuxK n=1 Tax=Geobacter argillaceus TaxID=345631 RepID=A0A562VLG2_9BACT|nr:DUF393 domain-containing protein [Geobacter argillaceus]TWJ18715.1 putative DCC family thiol-disulfide oxidoreductase YuxK [Geobacter argillaceus]
MELARATKGTLTAPAFPLKVLYDGSCSVCATEIGQYLKKDGAGRLVAVDISAPDFDPTQWGLTLDEVMTQLHAIDGEGRFYRGVEAFWAIWQAFPDSTRYGLLGALVTMPLLFPLARLAYRGFARIRRFLPKRRTGCGGGSCRLRRP